MRAAIPNRSPRHLLIVAGIALNLALTGVMIVLWFSIAREGLLWRADFTSFYTGWTMVRDGQGANLYDFDLQATYQQQILGGRSFADGLLPFVNPPHVALWLLPLAWLSRSGAHAVWLLLNVALLVALIRRLLRSIAYAWSSLEHWALVSVVLAFLPLFTSFLVGSFSLLLTLCVLNATLALLDDRPGWAAFWLYIGTFKFPLILLLAVWVLGARRWQIIVIGGIALLLTYLATSAAFGWDIWGKYWNALVFHSQSYNRFGIHPASTYSFKGALSLALGEQHITTINGVAELGLVVAGVITLWLAQRARTLPCSEQAIRLALVITLGVVFNLHLNLHDVLVVVPAGALLYDYVRQHETSRQVLGAFLLAMPLIFWIGEFDAEDRLGIRIGVLLLVLLLGSIVWALQRGRYRTAGIVASDAGG